MNYLIKKYKKKINNKYKKFKDTALKEFFTAKGNFVRMSKSLKIYLTEQILYLMCMNLV